MQTSCPNCGTVGFWEPVLGTFHDKCTKCGAELSPHADVAPTARELARTNDEYLACPISSDLDLSVQTVKSLRSMGILTIGDLVSHSAHEIVTAALNPRTIMIDIQSILQPRGLHLAPDATPQ